MSTILSETDRAALMANGRKTRDGIDHDPMPVVKLFTPDGACTWLLSELDPDQPDLAFGLCDLGLGYPELGTVSLGELEALRGPLGLPIECDLHFHPDKTLGAYADAAIDAGRVIA